MTSIPDRRIALTIQLAQNSQTGQAPTFAETGTPTIGLGNFLGSIAGGQFGGLGGGGNTVNIAGLRVSVRIRDAYMPMAHATVKVWGLSQSLMNQLSALGGTRNDIPQNKITISAGDTAAGQFNVFGGVIMTAYGEYENQPEVPLSIDALALIGQQVQATTPTSYPQAFSVATAFQSLAQKMGLQFTNLGVDLTLPPMYLSGSPVAQMKKLADAARISVGVNPSGFLEIIPKFKARQGSPVTISPQNGMIAYPAYTPEGVMVKTIFRPEIKMFDTLQIQSSVLSSITQVRNAAGANIPTQYSVRKIDLDLDAQVPKGQWMQTLYAYGVANAPNIAPPKT